jgi:hypothetical protein
MQDLLPGYQNSATQQWRTGYLATEQCKSNNRRLFYLIGLEPALKALIRSVMTYACPAWEFAAESHLLKLQRLQNRVLRTIGNHPRSTSVRDLRVAFKIPYVYDYITKLCRQQAEVIQNHDNENVRNIGQGEARQKI